MALTAATLASVIYGANFTIAKDVMPAYIQPFGFIVIRVGAATLLFWLVSLLAPKQKISRNDFPRIAAAALFGVAINMLSFFEGLSQTSPIMASVLMVTTPIIVLVLSAILMRERIMGKKALGIFLGLVGAVLLILYGKSVVMGDNALLGNFLVFINASSYGLYLIVVKKLMDKYHPLVFVRWIYLFGFIMVLPFGYGQFQQVQWDSMPVDIICRVGFVILFSTFSTYLLNLFAMKQLKPTTIATFVYLQPFFGTLFAIALGKDALDTVKVLSAVLIFTGVYLVTQRPKQISR